MDHGWNERSTRRSCLPGEPGRRLVRAGVSHPQSRCPRGGISYRSAYDCRVIRIVAPGMRTLAIVLWVLAVALLPLGLTGDRSVPVWLVPVPSLFIAFVAWAALWRPRIDLTDEALVVVDVRRTSTYAWPRVTGVKTKYGLEVLSSEGERRTWIAPRPTARLRLDGRPGGPVRLDVSAAADEILARVPEAAVVDGPPPATVVPQPITHRVHGWTVLAIVVLALAATLVAARL